MTPPKPTFPTEEARRWLRIAANVATILGFLLATTTALGWLGITPERGFGGKHFVGIVFCISHGRPTPARTTAISHGVVAFVGLWWIPPRTRRDVATRGTVRRDRLGVEKGFLNSEIVF